MTVSSLGANFARAVLSSHFAEPLSARNESIITGRFENFYDGMKHTMRPEHCTDTANLAATQRKYESAMRAVGASSIPGAGPSSSSKDVATVRAAARNLPAVSNARGVLPDQRAYAAQMQSLAPIAGSFVALAEWCKDPAGAVARRDFLSLAELVPAEKKALILREFERLASNIEFQARLDKGRCAPFFLSCTQRRFSPDPLLAHWGQSTAQN